MIPPLSIRPKNNGVLNGNKAMSGLRQGLNGIITVIGNLTPKKKVPKLTERAKENEKRDIEPDDIEDPKALLDDIDFSIKESDKKDKSSSERVVKQLAQRQLIIDDVMRDFKRSANAKQIREEKWFLAAAFERSNQWVEYDRVSRTLRHRWNGADQRDYYKTVNKIAPLLRKNTSRALSGTPDLDFIPIGDTELSRLSAKQRRQVWHHAEKYSDWNDVKEEGVYFGHCYPIFWKVVWDADAEDDIPQFKIVDPDEDADAGDEEQAGGTSAPSEQAGASPMAQGMPSPFAQQGAVNPQPPSAGGQTAQALAAIQQGRAQAHQQLLQERQQSQEQGDTGDGDTDDDGLEPLDTPSPEDVHSLTPELITSLPKMLRIVGSVRAPVGMAKIEYVSPFDGYPDPDARRWEHLRYFVHARRVATSEVQSMFGGAAYLVEPDKGGNSSGMESAYSDSRLAGITGDDRNAAGDGGDYVTLFERYEFKSPKYPKGRYSAVADGKLLAHNELPDQEYPNPFVPFYYQREVNSIWGRGIVPDMADPQEGYNAAYSHMMSRVRTDKLTVLYEEGSGLKPDDYTTDIDYRKLPVKKGASRWPELQLPSADWEKYERVMALCEQQMEDMIGIHDSSDGQVESAQQSGRQTYLLQQADNRIIREYTRRIEDCTVEIANRVISYFEKYATEPRLIGIDDTLSGDIPMSRLFLPDLMKAGQARCEVTTGSAMPENPGEEEAQLEHWFEMGLFGQPGTPEAAKAFLDALPTLKSSKIVDNVIQLLEKQQQKAMAAAQAIEQQKQQAEQDAANAQTQQKLVLLQAEGQQKAALMAEEYKLKATLPNPKGSTPATPEEEENARMVADNSVNAFKANLDAAAREHEATLDIGKEIALKQIDHQHAMEQAAQEHAHAMEQGAASASTDMVKADQQHGQKLEQAKVQGAQQSQMQDKQLSAQEKAAQIAAKAKASAPSKKS